MGSCREAGTRSEWHALDCQVHLPDSVKDKSRWGDSKQQTSQSPRPGGWTFTLPEDNQTPDKTLTRDIKHPFTQT